MAMKQKEAASVAPFGLRDKIGYMFGDFGNDFSFLLASSFLALFWTDGLGMAPAIGGTIMGIARIVDAFTDVGMGVLVDRSKPRKEGKFRPWIRRGMVPVALASFLMYLNFAASWPQGVKVAYMAVTYLLWGSCCYTFINIPYGSMAAVISSDPKDRSQLSVFRSVGASLAQLIITVSIPLLVNEVVDGQSTFSGQRMMVVAAACAILSVGCYLLCYRMVTERVRVPGRNASSTTVKAASKAEAKAQTKAGAVAAKATVQQVKKPNVAVALLTNRALLSLILSAVLLLLASHLSMGMASYLWKDYFGNLQLASWYNLVAVIPAFLLAPIAAWAAEKFGKREICAVMIGFAAVVYIALYLLQLSPTSVVVYLVIVFFALIGVAAFNLLVWAFITDVIDYQEVKSYSRDDGTVYAVYSWARKLGQALAAFIQGIVLTWIGYQSSTGGAVVQSEATKQGLYNYSALLPGILYALVCLTLVFLYPLSKRKILENTEILRERHAAQAQ